MLRFTKQTDYGLMAMQYMAEHQADGTVGVKQIADEFGIPPELLAKVLQRLVKRGLMVSRSGPHGGYRLALAPAKVSVGQVIHALEGPVAIVGCMTDHDHCPVTARCTLRHPAQKVQAAIARLLDTITLADVVSDGVRAGGEGNGVRADGEGAGRLRACGPRNGEIDEEAATVCR